MYTPKRDDDHPRPFHMGFLPSSSPASGEGVAGGKNTSLAPADLFIPVELVDCIQGVGGSAVGFRVAKWLNWCGPPVWSRQLIAKQYVKMWQINSSCAYQDEPDKIDKSCVFFFRFCGNLERLGSKRSLYETIDDDIYVKGEYNFDF